MLIEEAYFWPTRKTLLTEIDTKYNNIPKFRYSLYTEEQHLYTESNVDKTSKIDSKVSLKNAIRM